MPSPSKSKGNRFERELVNKAKEYGLDAKRAYASNGLSLGKTEDVDLLIEGQSYQAKCRKTIGELYKPNKNVFGQIFKEDRGDTYIMLRFDDYLKLLNSLEVAWYNAQNKDETEYETDFVIPAVYQTATEHYVNGKKVNND